jgi:hypothetical protein
MNTLSARDGKEMSTTVNRCSHLDEHNFDRGTMPVTVVTTD